MHDHHLIYLSWFLVLLPVIIGGVLPVLLIRNSGRMMIMVIPPDFDFRICRLFSDAGVFAVF